MSTKGTGSSGSAVESIEESEQPKAGDEGSTEQSDSEELSLDLIFEVLKNSRRREVLRYLREHDETTLSDVAEHIAALENDTDVRSLTSSQRKRVYVGLYQCHLPKMADMGVVDYDQNRGDLDLGPNADQLYEYIDNDESSGRPWHRYYLGISGVGLVLFVLSLVGGGVTLAGTAALGTLCLAITAVSVQQTLSQRESDA